MNFLYVFEDGTIKLGGKPTTDNYLAVEEGYLSIIDIKRKQEFTSDQGWVDLERFETEELEEEFEEEE